jgi:hypothetical protein
MDLSSLGDSSHGVWTRKQARQLLSDGQIDTFVRLGVWQVLWRGVYADGGFVPDAEQRGHAAVLAVGGAAQYGTPALGRHPLIAVACRRTAARVWQFPLIDDADPATRSSQHLLDDVAVARTLPRQHSAGRTLLPWCCPLPREDVLRLVSGLWVTTPARTLLDCAAVLTHEALVCALDDSLHRSVVTREELNAAVGASRGRRGAVRLAAAVAAADGRAESPAETLARLLLLPRLPDLEPQVELFDRAARLVACFDLGDRAVRLAVEADGTRNHAGTQMVAKDRRRDRVAEAYGWTTERATWFELRRQQPAFVRRIVERHAELTAARAS